MLTFRNVHNWMDDGDTDAVFAAFFRALKPGGILGVEEHRGLDTVPQDPKAENGYVRQDYTVALGAESRVRAGGLLRAERQPERYQGLAERRVDAAAELSRWILWITRNMRRSARRIILFSSFGSLKEARPSFLKKRSKKLLDALSRPSPVGIRQEAKVFCRRAGTCHS